MILARKGGQQLINTWAQLKTGNIPEALLEKREQEVSARVNCMSGHLAAWSALQVCCIWWQEKAGQDQLGPANWKGVPASTSVYPTRTPSSTLAVRRTRWY